MSNLLKLPEPSMPKANWTVIFQFSAENDLSSSLIDIYNKLTATGSTLGKINLVLIFDGIKEPVSGTIDLPSIYYIRQDVKFNQELPFYIASEDDITKPDIFSEIMNKIITYFPSENYGYFYNGHGAAGGTDVNNSNFIIKIDYRLIINNNLENDEELLKRLNKKYKNYIDDGWELGEEPFSVNPQIYNGRSVGIILEKEKNAKTLTYYTLSKLLHPHFNVKRKLSFICLDSCWGQLFENAKCLSTISDYLVASCDEMPVMGIGYESFVKELTKNPTIKPSELSNIMTSIFYQTNYNDYQSNPDFIHMGVSLSCVNLKHQNQVELNLNNLTGHLIINLEKLKLSILKSRSYCADFTYSPPGKYGVYNIDLIWFLQNLMSQNPTDDRLHILAFDLIKSIKLYYLSSFARNNYEEVFPPQKADIVDPKFIKMGGYGVTICFPEKPSSYKNSIFFEPEKNGHPHITANNYYWHQFLKKLLNIGESLPFVDDKINPFAEKLTSKWIAE